MRMRIEIKAQLINKFHKDKPKEINSLVLHSHFTLGDDSMGRRVHHLHEDKEEESRKSVFPNLFYNLQLFYWHFLEFLADEIVNEKSKEC